MRHVAERPPSGTSIGEWSPRCLGLACDRQSAPAESPQQRVPPGKDAEQEHAYDATMS